MAIYSRIPINLLIAFFLSTGTLFGYEVEGKILMSDPLPQTPVSIPPKHQAACAGEILSQALMVSRGGNLQNAVVYLKGDFSGALEKPQGEAVLDQKNCQFEPHVLLVPRGASFRVLNSDPMNHDVRAFERAEMLFRFDMKGFGKPVENKFDKPGMYVIRCGLHPWMHAYVVSSDHPYYAVTDKNGTFRLQNVPEGVHTLHLWHESLGEVDIPLKVSQSIRDFSYTFKKA